MNHKDYDHGLWEKLKAKSLKEINDKDSTIMGFDNFNEMIIASRTNINNVLPNNDISKIDILFKKIEKQHD